MSSGKCPNVALFFWQLAATQFSLSILACSFLGTCLPAKLELEGKSRTDGGARGGGENSCSILLLSPIPPTLNQAWAASPHRYADWRSVFKTKGFPLGWGCVLSLAKGMQSVSPRGEQGSEEELQSCLLQLSIHSMPFWAVKGTSLRSQQQAERWSNSAISQ